MCTLIVAHRVVPGRALLLVANRDERLGRAAEAPQVIRHRALPVLAPLDAKAGGTWLGVNGLGLVAAITNRFGMTSQAHHRSRGLLVFDALTYPSAQAAARALAATSAQAHNGFHLLVADREAAFLIWNDGQDVHTQQLPAGVHVLTERSLGAGDSMREDWLRDRLEQLQQDDLIDEVHLKELMVMHHESALESTCVHWPQVDYGTRSSTLISLGGTSGPGRDDRFVHACGPPCCTKFADYSNLLEDVLVR